MKVRVDRWMERKERNKKVNHSQKMKEECKYIGNCKAIATSYCKLRFGGEDGKEQNGE